MVGEWREERVEIVEWREGAGGRGVGRLGGEGGLYEANGLSRGWSLVGVEGGGGVVAYSRRGVWRGNAGGCGGRDC